MLLKNAPHQQYKLLDGTLVPGVTTILGTLDKPALAKWRWQCGVDGVPWPIPWESTAGVGTIAHYKIQCWLMGTKEEYDSKWDKAHIEMAEVPFKTFRDYYTSRGGHVILSEYSSVHQTQRYGGTLDLVTGTRTGPELWDIKTSKAIYEENYLQLAGYRMLLDSNSDWFRRGLGKVKPRVVLVTKDGRLEAPDVSKEYMTKAKVAWIATVNMYHRLQAFRKAA
jgi:hypothetical protein